MSSSNHLFIFRSIFASFAYCTIAVTLLSHSAFSSGLLGTTWHLLPNDAPLKGSSPQADLGGAVVDASPQSLDGLNEGISGFFAKRERKPKWSMQRHTVLASGVVFNRQEKFCNDNKVDIINHAAFAIIFQMPALLNAEEKECLRLMKQNGHWFQGSAWTTVLDTLSVESENSRKVLLRVFSKQRKDLGGEFDLEILETFEVYMYFNGLESKDPKMISISKTTVINGVHKSLKPWFKNGEALIKCSDKDRPTKLEKALIKFTSIKMAIQQKKEKVAKHDMMEKGINTCINKINNQFRPPQLPTTRNFVRKPLVFTNNLRGSTEPVATIMVVAEPPTDGMGSRLSSTGSLWHDALSADGMGSRASSTESMWHDALSANSLGYESDHIDSAHGLPEMDARSEMSLEIDSGASMYSGSPTVSFSGSPFGSDSEMHTDVDPFDAVVKMNDQSANDVQGLINAERLNDPNSLEYQLAQSVKDAQDHLEPQMVYDSRRVKHAQNFDDGEIVYVAPWVKAAQNVDDVQTIEATQSINVESVYDEIVDIQP